MPSYWYSKNIEERSNAKVRLYRASDCIAVTE